MAEIVFADKKKLEWLNKIVHPYLKEAIVQILGHSTSMVVINAAVLKEIGLVDHVDEVWLVTASKERRMKRLIKSGFSKEEANKRIRSQASQKEYLAIADQIIKNDGTKKQLQRKIQACLQV